MYQDSCTRYAAQQYDYTSGCNLFWKLITMSVIIIYNTYTNIIKAQNRHVRFYLSHSI